VLLKGATATAIMTATATATSTATITPINLFYGFKKLRLFPSLFSSMGSN
jgi:uncharacterized membrane protein